jgi:hypothetical protein
MSTKSHTFTLSLGVVGGQAGPCRVGTNAGQFVSGGRHTYLLELLDLRLLEHGEHIGVGPIRPLLGFLG